VTVTPDPPLVSAHPRVLLHRWLAVAHTQTVLDGLGRRCRRLHGHRCRTGHRERRPSACQRPTSAGRGGRDASTRPGWENLGAFRIGCRSGRPVWLVDVARRRERPAVRRRELPASAFRDLASVCLNSQRVKRCSKYFRPCGQKPDRRWARPQAPGKSNPLTTRELAASTHRSRVRKTHGSRRIHFRTRLQQPTMRPQPSSAQP